MFTGNETPETASSGIQPSSPVQGPGPSKLTVICQSWSLGFLEELK